MHPKDRGDISEAQILARLTERGFGVLMPWKENHRYDFVVETQGEFLSVQVKTARQNKEGAITFSSCSNDLRTGEKTDYHDEVDVFGIYSPDLKECFIVPVEYAGTTSMTLRYKMPKNNQRKGIFWAVDYII
jgi:hypothetical protein